MLKRTKIAAAVSAACSILASPVMAQDTQLEEVVVTGIRGSMQMAMDVKRDSAGVVDAISAEDMGKFPDTNLAESLQRVTGVSIDRSQGEGSQVTVRGFGGQFNLVTLNGRQMPAANVPNTSGNSFGASGNSRSFDFSTLASEGVSGLQVYKTGRASAPTGGIGAAINVNTIRPLESGNQAVVGAKLMDDKGGNVTPEYSGLVSWANDDSTLGVSLFASVQEREGSQRSGLNSGYVWLYPYDPSNGALANATHTNEPETGQLAAYPTNNRLDTSTYTRERTNAFLTLQYAPSDRLTITADAYYALNEVEQNSNQSQQWLARKFDTMVWDASGVTATPLSLSEYYNEQPEAPFTEVGSDIMDDNRKVRQNDEITSIGVNFDYRINDSWTANLDYATSEATSKGGFPGGVSVYRGVFSSAASSWRAFDLSQKMPNTLIAITDGAGNQDGKLTVDEIGTQQAYRDSSWMSHDVDQFQLTANWDNGGNITVDMGVGATDMKMNQDSLNEGYTLGGWGVAYTGDVEEMAPGLLYEVCGICKFKSFDFQANRSVLDSLAPEGTSTFLLGEQSFRADPYDFWFAMDGWDYDATREPFDALNPPKRGSATNQITEDVMSAFVSTTMEGEIGDKPMQLVAGIRYEETSVTSSTVQGVPIAFKWDSDNDTTRVLGSGESTLNEDHDYKNILPSLDFSVDLTDEFKARASFSRTIARPQYSYMFIPTNVSHGGTLTYLGGVPSASRGSAKLDPLTSDNFDLSFEYYYGDANYASIGYFQKAVSNFVGIEQVERQFFNLRNVTARAPGNRLDRAIQAFDAAGVANPSEEQLFTMVAILDNPADFPNGAADYDHGPGEADQALVVFNKYDVMPDNLDPLYTFQTALPVNNKTANLDGYELAIQHFFGESGFGVMANATLVNGDIAFDNSAPPNFDQFALEGLSDSANLILVWENDTFGARIAYNWRDAFLSSANAGNYLPRYTDEHSQVDVNFSWNVSDNLSLSLDGVNLTEQGVFQYGRTYNQMYINSEADARWVLAARYNF